MLFAKRWSENIESKKMKTLRKRADNLCQNKNICYIIKLSKQEDI